MKQIKKMVAIVIAAVSMCSCSTNTQTGGVAGAVIGGAAGNAIGKNSESTVIGATAGSIIGAFLGYVSDTAEISRPRQETVITADSGEEFHEIERKKVVTYKERVAVHKEVKTRKYFIDPKTGRKVYLPK